MGILDDTTLRHHLRERGAFLDAVRARESAAYDEAYVRETLLALDGLVSATAPHAPPRETSGLIEQQRLFRLLGTERHD
ncbi:MAG: hypothetical protein N3F11_01220 [Casimicrobiaceae bacterium]|nr:hypothetical protein [Casimicrobiaceae bacterium]